MGYAAVKKILASRVPFTALFAFNDVSAIGAIRALQDSGKHVPDQVSVVGFDDIYGAAFHIPALTTIRQPLVKMGNLAAETLIARIASGEKHSAVVDVEPELVIRESTAVPEGTTEGWRRLRPGMKRFLFTAHAVFALIGIANTMLGPLLPLLAQRWHLGDSQAGALFIAHFRRWLRGRDRLNPVWPASSRCTTSPVPACSW